MPLTSQAIVLRQTSVQWPGIFLLALFLAATSARSASALITLQDTTVSGTLSVPVNETADLGGTVTLDNATIDVSGSLKSRTGNVRVTGTGQILLNYPGVWHYDTSVDSLQIDPGIEVLGNKGAWFWTRHTTNRGTFAAVSGGLTNQAGFKIYLNFGFTNEGLMEARSGGRLWFHDMNGYESFNTTGTIRALPGGVVRMTGPSINSLAELGNLVNAGGLIEFDGTMNNGLQTVNFTGGDWALLSGARINGGSLKTSDGGRLLAARELYPSSSSEAIHFSGVNLMTDVYFTSNSAVEWYNSSLYGTVHFNSGVGELQFVTGSDVYGVGTIQTDGGSGILRAWSGTTVISPDVNIRATTGSLTFDQQPGQTAGNFELRGPVEAVGGTMTFAVPVTNYAGLSVHDGGRLSLTANVPFTNAGTVEIGNGGILNYYGPIDNQGSITIDHGSVVMRTGGSVAGPGTFTITDSTLATGQNMTLSQFMALTGTRVDRAIYSGTLDLQGAAIEIGDEPGQRWTLSQGTLTNGAVNSSTAAELRVTPPPTGLGTTATGTLLNVALNTNVRVPTGATLNVTGPITGTGNIIVDGGRLNLGSSANPTFVRPLLDRITPIAGAVVLTGPIDNVGQTIRLKAGVDWLVSHLRSDVFIGGRVEGEPGAQLRIISGYGSAGYATMRQGVTLALPTTIVDATRLYVLDGLTLDHTALTIGESMGKTFVDGRLVVLNTQTLGGTGEVRFNSLLGFPSHPTYPRINMIEVTAGTTLSIDSGITVRTSGGSGYIGGNYFYQTPPAASSLVNRGTMIAENGNALTVFASAFAQQGTLRADANSTFTLRQTTGANSGVIDVAGGTFAVVGQSYQNDPSGEVRGHGVLDVSQTSFTNGGRVAPQGTLSVHGNFAQASVGRLQLDVTGDTGGTSDLLAIDGQTALDGLLAISLFGAGQPMLGDSWSLLTAAGGVGGAFSSLAAPWLPADLALFVNYGANAVSATLVERIAGDFNGDSRVDTADYLVWRKIDGTQTGYDNWRLNFGRAYGAGGYSTGGDGLWAVVPEPNPAWMLILCTLLSTAGRRVPSRRVDSEQDAHNSTVQP